MNDYLLGQTQKAAKPAFTPMASGLLQRAAVNTATIQEAPPLVYEVLHSPGQSLDTHTRAFMEPRFGHDFSNVRVHTDSNATKSAEAVHAFAYTVGRDVVFGAGQYAPNSGVGQKLIAHELTHVVQQDSHREVDSDHGLTTLNSPALETEAHSMANSMGVLGGNSTISQAGSPAIQKWDSFEHVDLGDSAGGPTAGLIILACHDRDLPMRLNPVTTWPAQWQTLYARGTADQKRAITRGLTYGEMVALSGDFYADFEALNNAPLREIYDLIPLIRSTSTSTSQLQEATGGRYLALAKVNESHFSTTTPGRSNRETWRSMHMQAIAAARAGNSNLAWGINAAADHFLTDAFSGGHVRTPRSKLMGSNTGNIQSKVLHDLDNDNGVLVTNWRGDKWMAFGDDQLHNPSNIRNRMLVAEAVQLSRRDIENALSAGSAYPAPIGTTTFAAEQLIPFPVDPRHNNWSRLDYARMYASVARREGPGIVTGYFSEDDEIRDWVSRQSLDAIGRQPVSEKIRMINTLLDGWISDDDVIAIERICLSVTTNSEMNYISSKITPRLSEMTSLGQRTRVRVALSR